MIPARQVSRRDRSADEEEGWLQTGMDADIIVFDPATVRDRATYQRPNQTSFGMRDVLVNGVFVIQDGELQTNVFPGQPIRRPVFQSTRLLSSRGQ